MFLLIGYGLAFSSVDGPNADQMECGGTDAAGYALHHYSSDWGVFLLDDWASLPMYDNERELGKKYEFRMWMRPTSADVQSFRVRVTTSGQMVSCDAPQTLVYTAAEPSQVGCCGEQTQCEHIGDIKEHWNGRLKSCIYECQCMDARCQCSHLVIRFYYVPWFGVRQLKGNLYHLMGI